MRVPNVVSSSTEQSWGGCVYVRVVHNQYSFFVCLFVLFLIPFISLELLISSKHFSSQIRPRKLQSWCGLKHRHKHWEKSVPGPEQVV